MAPGLEPPLWIGDREFSATDLDLVGEVTRRFPRLSRWELALTICENLGWDAPNGRPRANSCLVLLEQLAAAGRVVLPPKVPHQPHRPRPRTAEALPPVSIVGSLADVRPLTVAPVPPEEQAVWDATMAAEHGMGFRRLSPAVELPHPAPRCADAVGRPSGPLGSLPRPHMAADPRCFESTRAAGLIFNIFRLLDALHRRSTQGPALLGSHGLPVGLSALIA